MHLLNRQLRRLEMAAAEAPPLRAFESLTRPSRGPDLHKPDNTPVIYPRSFRRERGQVLFSDVHDLAGGLELTASTIDPTIEEDFIKGAPCHESEHGETALELGAGNVRYALQYGHHQDLGPVLVGACCIITNLTTTKLGTAAIVARPVNRDADWSRADIATLRSNGFSGIDDVGRRAYAQNQLGDQPIIPLPLSWDPQTDPQLQQNGWEYYIDPRSTK
jgi:hypothetical protein